MGVIMVGDGATDGSMFLDDTPVDAEKSVGEWKDDANALMPA
jgi:hypothetical protein